MHAATSRTLTAEEVAIIVAALEVHAMNSERHTVTSTDRATAEAWARDYTVTVDLVDLLADTNTITIA